MIGIIAPSSKVPQIELEIGVERIQREGFLVQVHPQCRKEHLFFAGTDEERAQAFFEFAKDPEISVLWCARGGHGAIRLLALLEKLTQQEGIPSKKLLIGYSDATALMEFVRQRWGWSILHGPMPSMRKFSLLPSKDWAALAGWIKHKNPSAPWSKTSLKFWTPPPSKAIEGQLIGGNLTPWDCLTGTPIQPNSRGKILFFEEVDEGLYRMDRVLHHLNLAGRFHEIRAIVLGNFLNCRDAAPQVLKKKPEKKSTRRILTEPRPRELQPLRKLLPEMKGLQEIFKEIGRQHGIPVAFGLPVGHGPGVSPLPLGARYRLNPDGILELLEWDWLNLS
jgi:muramoyltetrapeptide carboxypeptidase